MKKKKKEKEKYEQKYHLKMEYNTFFPMSFSSFHQDKTVTKPCNRIRLGWERGITIMRFSIISYRSISMMKKKPENPKVKCSLGGVFFFASIRSLRECALRCNIVIDKKIRRNYRVRELDFQPKPIGRYSFYTQRVSRVQVKIIGITYYAAYLRRYYYIFRLSFGGRT